ncbi:MAG: putative 2-aminoethylphosphonate ABC transporter permease subunit [Syntrophobacteraceae bacterium]|nr:putative 2-aminoethylphosphonate ABC transporter permease subunit [Syntrophobacteraceae bacterium]
MVDLEKWVRRALIITACLWMVCCVLLPVAQLLWKSFLSPLGDFIGLSNYVTYFRTPALSSSLTNSLFVSTFTTAVSTSIGFAYAHALTRTCIPFKGFFQGVVMMPLFAPTLLNGIALVYLFGRKGLITQGFLGVIPGCSIELYGPFGIVCAEVLYTLPQAVLILSVALRMTDARLYEASASLGASRMRTFLTITLPGIKFGLISTFFVCFVLAFTDFGAPKVVGGHFNVLATDIYKQVIGQQNFVMGAVVSSVLLVPTLIAFVADRICQRRQFSALTARAIPLVPQPSWVRDVVALALCTVIAATILGFYGTALFASLVKVWPYDLSLGFQHYDFSRMGGGGIAALINSVRMSLYSAVLGTMAAFGSAYLIEKGRGMRTLRQISYMLSLVPLALPGMVIGLSYIFFFNTPSWLILGWSIPNPFHILYGTMGILVLSNVVHFYTVSFLTATTALKQLDREFETVSESLGVPFYRTFIRVTVPVCLPAAIEIAVYYFVNSMATVSAVIFLYNADLPLASVAVANMDDAGDIAPAAAMAMLIVGVNILARGVHGVLKRWFVGSTQAWAAR